MKKKKIAILGSTGSIGKSLIKIIKKDKKNFDVRLLSAEKNHKLLLKQAKLLNVKNLIISNLKSYHIIKKKLKGNNIRVFNNYQNLNKIFPSKIDYTMSAISGLEGLYPTKNIIKYTKLIAIANKETIICAWNILKKEIDQNKTEFIPVDSEHFSLWFALKGLNSSNVKKIYLTASGGPFENYPINKLQGVRIVDALKHPNWRMGKKISIDSATMMNKVFEIIEAKNLFNVDYDKLSILIHPKSYIHAIVQFNSGLTKLVAHDTDMKFPIFNTIYHNFQKKIKFKDLDLIKLNGLNLKKVNLKRFPSVKIIRYLTKNLTLFNTVVVSANDTLVDLYLKKKIKFTDIQKKLFTIIKSSEFTKYKRIKPKKINEILNLNCYVSSRINSMFIKKI